VEFLRVGFRVSERRACGVIAVDRGSYRYKPVGDSAAQVALRIRIRDLSAVRIRYGYRRLHVLLKREGWTVNHKRIYRLYRQEGLSLRLKSRKKRVSTLRPARVQAQCPNEHWSMDFVADQLADGRRFRVLTLVDNFSRVSPAIRAERSMGGDKVVEVLEEAAHKHGGVYPKVISVDNGPEFTSRALDEWAHRRGVRLQFSRPATPTDNPYIESFNGRLREECLNQHWFESMEEARGILESWRMEYNTERPHGALENRTPMEHLRYLAGLPASKAGENTSQGPVVQLATTSLETVRLTL
jgi:putative transposase